MDRNDTLDMEMILQEAIRIARSAGHRILELREADQFQESLKDGVELLTTADLESNEIIKAEILRLFPTHQILSEEDSGPKEISAQLPTWVIDPIDGTVCYANHHYQVAVSIAFAVENKVRVGVVYNPFLDELFYASEGAGAFLNGKAIQVKDVSKLNQCLVGTGFPYKKDDLKDILRNLANVLPHSRDIRRLGSAALDMCWVACGRLQAYYEGLLHPWDVAAARLIAVEAGAAVGHYGPWRDSDPEDDLNGNCLIVSSPGVFQELQELLMK